ncbi:hypothetical protein M1D88_18950 [Arthrobacter sp. R1-13]
MFTVFQTMTGFHGGLRRGAAAGALGAMLVLSAGIPVANAAGRAPQDTCFLLICSPSPPETAEPTPTQPAPAPTRPSEAPGSPSNPPPDPAPAVPSGPGPAEETVAPSYAPSPNPSAPADSSLDGDDPGASSTDSNSVTDGSGSNAQQVQVTGGAGPAGQGIAPASGAKDNSATSSRHLEQASLVHQGKGSALVWWGIVALAVAGIALAIFFRLRRTEKLLTKSP